ncbi:MAG: hypothetical protein AAF352_06975, partial [Pseudomonadota bacterium]
EARTNRDAVQTDLDNLGKIHNETVQALQHWQKQHDHVTVLFTQATQTLDSLQTREEALIIQCEDDAQETVMQKALDDLQSRLAIEQNAYQHAAQKVTRLEITRDETQHRIQKYDQDLAQWQQRTDNAKMRVAEMQTRLQSLQNEQNELQDKPTQLRHALQRSDAALHEKKQAVQQTKSALDDKQNLRTQAQTKVRHLQNTLHTCEQDLQQNKQTHTLQQAQCQQIDANILARFEMTPAALFQILEYSPEDPWPFAEQTALEHEAARLQAQREALGPVNLLAENECADLEALLKTLIQEQEDLTQAIQRLYTAIREIKAQARDKIVDAFAKINQHFQELFVTLFGGGRAELRLSDPDDPLLSGLEIVASPAGKSLKSLSLLSGGEQALSAIALVFAAFKVTPAPICVLDEVDAPLDDNNVRKFCDLVAGMAKNGETRFLLITHHRMTMARADRLFGITMARPGISQLVSVDLQRAQQYAA